MEFSKTTASMNNRFLDMAENVLRIIEHHN